MKRLRSLGRYFWRQPRRWWLAAICGGLVGIATGHTFKAPVSVVDGASMAPTFEPGAHIFCLPIASPLERGDVVLLDDRSEEFALKRIVGMPGETGHIWRGYVCINRVMLREPYLSKFSFTCPDERSGAYSFQLANNQYFVLGDNRLCSRDSRAYGPVNREQIKSRVSLPENAPRAEFARYTLPASGKNAIRRLGADR